MDHKIRLRPIRQQATRRRGRRSQRRLAGQSIRYETTTPRLRLSVTPALGFWQAWGGRIVGGLALALLVWITFLLFTEDAFYVYDAEVRGNRVLSAAEIYSASGVDSQSVFWLDPSQIAANVTRLPNVKTARVKVSLPARVTITVEERLPLLVWQTGETTWWVDSEGTVVPPRSEASGHLLVIDDDGRPLQVNDRIAPTLIEGVNQLRVLRPDSREIHYSQAHGLSIVTPEGWPAYLGDGSEMAAKLAVLEAVRYDLVARNVTPQFIDVSFPRRVVYR